MFFIVHCILPCTRLITVIIKSGNWYSSEGGEGEDVGEGVGVEGIEEDETMIPTEAVTLPAAFVALMVYIEVIEGETPVVPLNEIGPIPWSILTSIAFDTSYESSEESPAVIDTGLALNVIITGLLDSSLATAPDISIVPVTSSDHRPFSFWTLR